MTYLLSNKSNLIVPGALIGLAISIPLSITLASIFWVTSLVLILLTPTYQNALSQIFKSPITWCSIGIFLIALISCLWGEASVSAKLSMLSKYLKFLFFPLLIAGFIPIPNEISTVGAGLVPARRWASTRLAPTKIQTQVMHAFLGAMLLTTILSFLKWTHLIIWRSADPGEVFYNHIMTGLMMSYAAYMACWFAYVSKERSHQSCYVLLFVLFTFQIFFISPARTGYIIYFLVMTIFLLQIFPLKLALPIICISGVLFGLIIYQSPAVKEGIYNFSHDLLGYKNHYLNTSLGYRIQFHDYAKELFYRHCFLGNGIAGFEHAFHTENPVPSWRSNYLSEPHSEYWLILSEFGLVGFAIFSCFLIAVAREIAQLKNTRILAIGIFSIFLIGNFSDSLFFYSTTNLFFMTMIAMCLGEKYEH
jgi:hypothetical protein